jgi:cytoskeletal protein CcmA (bactofilin family)
MPKDELPSIEQFVNNDNLPSVEDFLTEEVEQQLPSVETFIEKEEEEIQEIIEEFVPEEKSFELNEVLRLINDVRESIPDIPEIKYYDKELEDICESIQLLASSIPEVKYYDSDIEKLQKDIQEVKSEIPVFPKWVNEVNEVPDFSWIGKTFSVIDDDFIKVNDTIETLRERVEINLREVVEENETKHFETKVQLETEIKELDEKYQEVKDRIWKQLRESSLKIWEYHKEFKDDDRKLKKQITNEYNSLKNNLEEKLKEFNENSIKTDKVLLDYFENLKKEISSLPEVKYYDEDIKHVRKDIKDLYDLVRTIKSEQKDLQESILREPPEEKESIGAAPDPLTPLDQKFATLDDLANHYRIFINRIQTQLSSMGGGGAGFIKDLDDVSFDQTTGNGKLLIYDQSNSRWVGIASTALSSGGDLNTTLGLGNTSSLGMSVGVVTATSFVGNLTGNATGLSGTPDLTVRNIIGVAATFTGNVSIAGTLTYEDVTNVDSVGIITARSDVIVQQNLSVAGVATFNTLSGVGTVYVGLGSTALYVDGNARVTGILTVGKASVTIDGNNNTIRAGDVFITGSSVTIGDNVTINTGATGINSAPNVIYVAKDGDDSKNGTSIDNAKLTIAGAVAIAQTGTTIKVLSGTYNENNPITVPAFVSIIGDNLKTVTVIPNNSTQDIFYVNKGTYLANMTFVGHVAPSAAVAFPPAGASNVSGGSWESPYVQNCTSNTTTGTGMRIDGNLAEGLKSMVVDSYTQYNQGGVGIAVTNNGYAQLVSVFTICCNEGITAYKGGQCSLTNSNTDFGTYGLVADGVSDLQFTGIVTTSASAGTDRIAVAINTTTRPYEGQVLYFDTLYYTVESITVTNGGSGYTSTPSVTLGTPSGPNGSTATAFATLEGDRVSTITIISSGSQYTSAPSVTISAPDAGVTATATANISPVYYTINSSTPVVSGITTITIDENLNNTVGVGTTAYFYQVSTITASSHTFEYVGSGNDIATAVPQRGGVAVQENEVVSRNGGRVVFTSTDQAGNFRIGDGIIINQNNGTISGRAFTRSLFNQMTPFILALS